jgi:hypothetical protein
VKSCSTIRATTKGISSVRAAFACQEASADRVLGDALAVAVAQEGLEHQPDRHREPGDVEAGLGQGGERVEAVLGPVRLEGLAGAEGIARLAHRAWVIWRSRP